MSKKKGYGKFENEKKLSTKQVINNIVEEHPFMQRSAYEAKHAAVELEKLDRQLYQMVQSMNSLTCGLANLLIKKELITEEELSNSIYEYNIQKQKDEQDMWARSQGFGDPIEQADETSLILAYVSVFDNGEICHSYPKQLYFMTNGTYLYPGFEEQLVGMKIGEEKEFDLTMPTDLPIEALKGKELHFSVKALDIRKRLPQVKENTGEQQSSSNIG